MIRGLLVNTPQRPVRQTVGGITFDDPYQWLEEDSAEAGLWEEQQDKLAREQLHALPAYDSLRDALEPHLVASCSAAPVRCGEGWLELAASKRGVALRLVQRPGEHGRVLVATASLSNERPMSLDWYYPSPDGRYVAYGTSEGGDEQSVLHLVETSSGRVLADQIPFTSFARVAWLPDSSGFYYNAGAAPDTVCADKFIFYHRVGNASVAMPELVRGRWPYLFPQLSADGRFLAAVSSETEPRPEYVKDLNDGSWRPFLRDVPGVFYGTFVGSNYVAITYDGADLGRVVEIPVASGNDASTWRELIPEGDGVMRSLSLVAEKLVLGELVDGHSRIRIFSLNGVFECEVPLPDAGTVNIRSGWSQYPHEPMVAASGNVFSFLFASHRSTAALYRYDVSSGELECLAEPALELAHLRVRRLACQARDGKRLPMWLVHRADLDLSKPHPTLLYGYGGWNVATVPSYVGWFVPFVEAGGVLVFPNLRGGGELGWDWWNQGRLRRKQGTFDDLYAAAEFLVREGIAHADRIALAGASNGGLLAAAALTQRPELFRAVVALMPVIDQMRFARDAYPAECMEDYGNPFVVEDAAALYAYSPYHAVRAGVAYPATLVVCADNDIRTPPWHSRKFVARLQQETSGDRPILLRRWQNAGHLGDPTKTAEWLGFIMSELAMTP
jgi:prolyl oligopeptidase